MEDQNSILQLLHDELPDPNQEVWHQPLHAFHLFSKLPIELRHKIWRATFPKRNLPNLTRDNFEVQGYTAPIASYISQESRSETLLHYNIIPHLVGLARNYWKTPKIRKVHTFWNSQQDVLILDASWVIQSVFRPKGFPLMQFFDQGSETISMIRYMEIWIEDWNEYPTQWRVQYYAAEYILPLFVGLRQLRVRSTFYEARWEGPETAEENGQKCKAFFEYYFLKRGLEDPSRSVPKIVISRETSPGI